MGCKGRSMDHGERANAIKTFTLIRWQTSKGVMFQFQELAWAALHPPRRPNISQMEVLKMWETSEVITGKGRVLFYNKFIPTTWNYILHHSTTNACTCRLYFGKLNYWNWNVQKRIRATGKKKIGGHDPLWILRQKTNQKKSALTDTKF